MAACKYCDKRGRCTNLCVPAVRVRRGIDPPPKTTKKNEAITDRGPYDPDADYTQWSLPVQLMVAMSIPGGLLLTWSIITLLEAMK